jgi:hypothetical protein
MCGQPHPPSAIVILPTQWNRAKNLLLFSSSSEGFLGCFCVVAVVHVRQARLCLWTAATKGPILHTPGDTWVWRATVEWYRAETTEKLRDKLVPEPLCLPQISHGLTRARTQAFAVTGRRLSAWVMHGTGNFLCCSHFWESLRRIRHTYVLCCSRKRANYYSQHFRNDGSENIKMLAL